jgi:hypothetical protein
MNTSQKKRVVGDSTEETLPPQWCNECRAHYTINHYDAHNVHKAHRDYGPYGYLLEMELALERVVWWYQQTTGKRVSCLNDLVELYNYGERYRDHGHRPRR